jgi:hypothetical protein
MNFLPFDNTLKIRHNKEKKQLKKVAQLVNNTIALSCDSNDPPLVQVLSVYN